MSKRHKGGFRVKGTAKINAKAVYPYDVIKSIDTGGEFKNPRGPCNCKRHPQVSSDFGSPSGAFHPEGMYTENA